MGNETWGWCLALCYGIGPSQNTFFCSEVGFEGKRFYTAKLL